MPDLKQTYRSTVFYLFQSAKDKPRKVAPQLVESREIHAEAALASAAMGIQLIARISRTLRLGTKARPPLGFTKIGLWHEFPGALRGKVPSALPKVLSPAPGKMYSGLDGNHVSENDLYHYAVGHCSSDLEKRVGDCLSNNLACCARLNEIRRQMREIHQSPREGVMALMDKFIAHERDPETVILTSEDRTRFVLEIVENRNHFFSSMLVKEENNSFFNLKSVRNTIRIERILSV